MGEAIHAHKEGWLGRVCAPQRGGDLSNLGAQARGHNDAKRPPTGHQRSCERHVLSIGNSGIAGQHHAGRLADGKRFAREQRLIDLDSSIGSQADVRRDLAAGFQYDEITRHQLACRKLLVLAIADDIGSCHRECAQGLGAPLGTVLLYRANEGVDQEDREDEAGIGEVAHRRGDRCGNEQDVHEWVAELTNEDSPHTGR